MRASGGGKRFKLTAPDPSEDELQSSIADLLNAILMPGAALFSHFPAGGYHLTEAARARLYRLGLRRGWPDIIICYSGGRSLWLEVKTPTGVLSHEQRTKHTELRCLGHTVLVVRSVEDVIAALITHGVPFRKARIAGYDYGKSNTGAAPGLPTQPP